VMPALARQFRVIALDQRGRGLSDWDPLRRYVRGGDPAGECAFIARVTCAATTFHLPSSLA